MKPSNHPTINTTMIIFNMPLIILIFCDDGSPGGVDGFGELSWPKTPNLGSDPLRKTRLPEAEKSRGEAIAAPRRTEPTHCDTPCQPTICRFEWPGGIG